MDIKAVMKNVKNKGLKETLAIREARQVARGDVSSDDLNFRCAVLEGEAIQILKQLDKGNLDESTTKAMLSRLKTVEATPGYQTFLKRKYIKHVLPAVYNLNRNRAIEKKMLFMQPRTGLNQSCAYMYHTLKEQGKYKLKLYQLNREYSYTQYYQNAVKWVAALATAKACFVHESNDLLGYVDIRPETKIVQLWHGCGILKKIGLSTADKKDFKSSKLYQEYPEYNKYDIVTIPSPAQSWIYEEFMGIKKESGIIQPIGVSRTDEFFDPEYIKKCFDMLHELIPESKGKKVILYAPTYRGVGVKRTAPDKLDIAKFAKALSDEYILIIKHHQTVQELPKIPEEYRDKFAFDMTRGRGMGINDLMTVADICISDYSSLVFEYALFEKPIMAFAYDLEEYIDKRGLYYDFEEIIPGPICKTNEEMIAYIKDIDRQFDKQRVIDFKNLQMSACDGHATQRIIDWIEK